jgi:hypothetical protein
MPSPPLVVLCGMCVAMACGAGGDGGGVDAVEADAPGRLRARCVTSMALRMHTASWAGVGGSTSLPAVCAQVAQPRHASFAVCDLEGHAHAPRERDGRRRLQSLPACCAQVPVARPASLVVCDHEGHAHAQRE